MLSQWMKQNDNFRPAGSSVLTRRGVAEVALGEDLVLHLPSVALEEVGGTGQQQLVPHQGGLSALGDAGLNVVGLDPLGEPAHAAVAVEGVGSKSPGIEILGEIWDKEKENIFCCFSWKRE